MKIQGFVITLIANPNGEGSVVDIEALKAAWIERDIAGQDDRWATFHKSLGETLAVKAAWYPIFEEALNGFWGVKQYQYEKISPSTVLDMVWDRVRLGREIDLADYSSVKAILAEFIADHTAAPGEKCKTSIMWRDSAKGPGAKLYLNPFVRARWTVQSDD